MSIVDMTARGSRPRDLDLATLGGAMVGDVVGPGSPDWDLARQAWDLSADQHPAMVGLPESVQDVQALVRYALRHDLRIAAQSTGHAAGALAPRLSGTLLIRFGRMRRVTVDPVARRARVEAGAWWGDVTSAAGVHGLAALAGSSSDVGVAGYTLGGGIGWLARRHGLAANSVLAIEVITADGDLVRCDHRHQPDLFWALRGGGGSFGVVTAIELALYPVAEVFAGALFFPWERSSEVLQTWAAWTDTVPDTLTSVGRILQLPPIPDIPEPLRDGKFVVVEGCYLGAARHGDELLAPLRALGPTIDTFDTIPATQLARLHMDPEGPTSSRTATRLLSELPAEAVDALVAAAGPASGSALVSVEVRHLGAATGRSSPDHGALDRLDGDYLVFGVGVPFDPDHLPAIDASLTAMETAVAPWATGRTYLNFAELPTDPSQFWSPATYQRLKAVKAAIDPDGRFLSNHPVPLPETA